ncbi:UDP-glycosyltransferase protein [Vigna angularis]|uniref:UDP-glycosyltransferase protein n=1 Tax=Phaseolus angularis TaxID=3914 RepID=A0A8T0JL53_PHAAN|nr:UDP-glycosyltransferase protein [Vigna angularis]
MCPALGIGHPKLIQTHHLNITIILPTGLLDHPTIEAYICRITVAHPSISFLRLSHIPFSTSTSVSLAARAFGFIKANASSVATSLSQISQTSPVKAFFIDLFCTSAMESTSSMGIIVYNLFTSGVAVLMLFSYFPKLHEERSESFKDMIGVELRVPSNTPLKVVGGEHVESPIRWLRGMSAMAGVTTEHKRGVFVFRKQRMMVMNQELAKPGDQFDLASVLPYGFLEKTKDRGMVVKAWALQVEVPSHESNSFITILQNDYTSL